MDKARVTCPGCKRNLAYGSRGCFYCGTSLIDVKPEIKCYMCGNILRDYEKCCTFCGNVFVEEERIYQSKGIPGLPSGFILPVAVMKNINLTPESMEFEKGNPPESYEVPWKFIVEFNCYSNNKNYLFEIFFMSDNIKNREILIDHNFNYRRVLGAELEFNRDINFRKMVKKIKDHLPEDVIVNKGVSYLTAEI